MWWIRWHFQSIICRLLQSSSSTAFIMKIRCFMLNSTIQNSSFWLFFLQECKFFLTLFFYSYFINSYLFRFIILFRFNSYFRFFFCSSCSFLSLFPYHCILSLLLSLLHVVFVFLSFFGCTVLLFYYLSFNFFFLLNFLLWLSFFLSVFVNCLLLTFTLLSFFSYFVFMFSSY